MAEDVIPPVAESCKTCRFLGPPTTRRDKAGLFACRRYPPTVALLVKSREFTKDHYTGATTWTESITDQSFFPLTRPDGWCGEYRAQVEGKHAKCGLDRSFPEGDIYLCHAREVSTCPKRPKKRG